MKPLLLFVLPIAFFGACERHTLEETMPAREFEKHHEEKFEAAKAAKETRPTEEASHH